MSKRAMGTIQTAEILSRRGTDAKGRTQAQRILEDFITPKIEAGEKIALLYAANTTQRKDLRECYEEGETALPVISGAGQARLFNELIPFINKAHPGQVRVLPIATVSYDRTLPLNRITLDEDLTLIQQHMQEGYAVYGIPYPEREKPKDCPEATYAIGGGVSAGFYQGKDITHDNKRISFGHYVQLRLQGFEKGIFPDLSAPPQRPLPSNIPPKNADQKSPPVALKDKSVSPPPPTPPSPTPPPALPSNSKPQLDRPSDPKSAHEPQAEPSHPIEMKETNGVIELTGTKLTAKISGYQDKKGTPTLTLSSLNQLTDEKIAETCEADIVGMLDKLQEKLAGNAGKWQKVNGKFVVKVEGDLDPQALTELKKIINASDNFTVAEPTPTQTLSTVSIRPRERLPSLAPASDTDTSVASDDEEPLPNPPPRPGQS